MNIEQRKLNLESAELTQAELEPIVGGASVVEYIALPIFQGGVAAQGFRESGSKLKSAVVKPQRLSNLK